MDARTAPQAFREAEPAREPEPAREVEPVREVKHGAAAADEHAPALRVVPADPAGPDRETPVEAPPAAAARSEPAAGTDPEPAAPPPFVPMHPLRAMGYFAASVVLALAQGFGSSVISVNLQQVQASFGATQAETAWLVAAYLAPNVSLTLALIKIRAQYGLRNFAELSILGFLAAALLNFIADDIQSAMFVRFMSGVAAAPMTSLAFLYMLEPLPPHRKLNVGLSLALTFIFMGSSLTRLVSPHLLEAGLYDGLTAMEVALAMIGFGLIYLLPLASPPREKVIEAADVISYSLIAVGFGAAVVAFTLGPTYWWLDTPWLGWLIAIAVGATALAAVIELNRATPLLDIRWLASPAILRFTLTLLLFRLVLSEQTSGAAGLFRALGLLNEDMSTLFAVVLAATIAGGLVCAVLLKPGRDNAFHMVALALIVVGASMDATATVDTRPANMLLSQGMIAFASALFLPPAMLAGLMTALAKGRQYLLSFIIVFLTTQKLGGSLGGALFSTFVQVRQTLHLERIAEGLALTSPFVAERVSALGAATRSMVTDPTLTGAEGLALLRTEVANEAAVRAYNDAFFLIAVIAAAVLAVFVLNTLLRAAIRPAAATA